MVFLTLVTYRADPVGVQLKRMSTNNIDHGIEQLQPLVHRESWVLARRLVLHFLSCKTLFSPLQVTGQMFYEHHTVKVIDTFQIFNKYGQSSQYS